MAYIVYLIRENFEFAVNFKIKFLLTSVMSAFEFSIGYNLIFPTFKCVITLLWSDTILSAVLPGYAVLTICSSNFSIWGNSNQLLGCQCVSAVTITSAGCMKICSWCFNKKLCAVQNNLGLS